MGKYLKKFNSHAEYNAFTATTAFILPNVSLCVNEDDLHYNPLVRVSGVTLDKSELSLKEGDTETLVASILPYNASNKNVVWSSSDDSIATVSSNGTVSGVAFGNADITVTTEDGDYTAQCATTVKSYKVITYTATAKLPETTSSYDSGLHKNSFTGTSGQRLTMVSHTFEDGVGTVTFNGDIAKFDGGAFFSATSLTSIDIPDSVTSIGTQVFANCSSLTSIEIPDSVTSIGSGMCSGCTSLTSATIGSGVTSIGGYAFFSATSLTSIVIPDNVTSIANGVFRECKSLTSIVIPDSVTSIGDSAFHNCSSLTSIEIPSGVTSIGISAFYNCNSLTSIDIPDSVTSIGQGAFYYCTRLTSIDIPSGVTSIGNSAFWYCASLTSVTVNAITPPTLGANAFYETNYLLIYVPSESVDTYKSATNWSNYASRIQPIV